MAWEAYYDDLKVFSSEAGDKPADLPLEGIHAVKHIAVVNGVRKSVVRRADVFSFEPDGRVFADRLSLEAVKTQRPNAVCREGRTCSTSRAYEIELLTGMWNPKNEIPFDGWIKDLIGWRYWTRRKVFDSKGVLPADWPALWASLPATEGQYLKPYENWKTAGGIDYSQNHAADFYFMAPSDSGLLLAASNETDLETRYPGAVVKEGTQIPDAEWRAIMAAADAAKTL